MTGLGGGGDKTHLAYLGSLANTVLVLRVADNQGEVRGKGSWGGWVGGEPDHEEVLG